MLHHAHFLVCNVYVINLICQSATSPSRPPDEIIGPTPYPKLQQSRRKHLLFSSVRNIYIYI